MTGQPSVPLKNFSDSEPRVPEVLDEVLRDLYATRDAYAAEHGYDLDRIFADLTRREKSSEVRLFRASE